MLAELTVIERVALLIVGLCLLSGCNRGDSSTPRLQGSSATNSSAIPAPDSTKDASGLNRCALLTDPEVRDAIGPHDAGTNDVTNEWGVQSCRWIPNSPQKNGASSEWIEVALFFKETEPWAREQAEGGPVKGFVDGARYDPSYGVLWFNCAHSRFCVVKAHIASPEPRREQVARQLAELVEKRLR